MNKQWANLSYNSDVIEDNPCTLIHFSINLPHPQSFCRGFSLNSLLLLISIPMERVKFSGFDRISKKGVRYLFKWILSGVRQIYADDDDDDADDDVDGSNEDKPAWNAIGANKREGSLKFRPSEGNQSISKLLRSPLPLCRSALYIHCTSAIFAAASSPDICAIVCVYKVKRQKFLSVLGTFLVY